VVYSTKEALTKAIGEVNKKVKDGDNSKYLVVKEIEGDKRKKRRDDDHGATPILYIAPRGESKRIAMEPPLDSRPPSVVVLPSEGRRRRRSPPPTPLPEILTTPSRFSRLRSRSPPVSSAIYEQLRSPIEIRRGSSPPSRYSLRSSSPLRERVVVAERYPNEKYVYEPLPSKTYETSRYSSMPPSPREIIVESSFPTREYPPKPMERSSTFSPISHRLSPDPYRRASTSYSSQPEAYGGSDYITSANREITAPPSGPSGSKVVVYDYKGTSSSSRSSYYEPERYRTNYEYR